MKLNFFLSALLASALSFQSIPAIAGYNDMGSDNRSTEKHMHRNKKDGAILAWVIALDKNEITAGKLATRRKLNPMVENYAAYLVSQHSQNLKQTFRVSHEIGVNPIKGQAAISLQNEGRQLLSELKPLDNKEFQKTYIEAMVKGHAEAAQTLKKYIQNMPNPTLRRHLVATREHVKMHLEKAKSIQQKLDL